MVYYHGTNKANREKILKEGFILAYGRFGEGAYFTSNLDEAKGFGSEICKVSVPEDKVLKIYYPDLINNYPDLSIEEEEGVTELRDFVLSKGCLAVEIRYVSGDIELCVYDPNIIKIIG